MRGHSSILVAVALGLCLASAQLAEAAQTATRTTVLPQSTVCVPIASGMPTMSYMMPMGMTGTPIMLCPMGTALPISSMYPTATSQDTALLVNELRQLRAEIRASTLTMQGQDLANRMNRLMAEEMAFRQRITAQPNREGARAEAIRLQTEANLLSSDLAAYQRELALIPAQDRPFLASRMASFENVYWQPATQQFSQFSTQFQQQAGTAYQPAVAANPWLTDWRNNFQASLTNIGGIQTAFAGSRWWAGTAVAGQPFPSGMVAMTQNGMVMYIPPDAFLTPGMTGA